MGKRPTISELEAILQSEDEVEIEILPNGEVRAKNETTHAERGGRKPLTMREDLGGEYSIAIQDWSAPYPASPYENRPSQGPNCHSGACRNPVTSSPGKPVWTSAFAGVTRAQSQARLQILNNLEML